MRTSWNRTVPFATATIALLCTVQAMGQGFSGLGTNAKGFAVPERGNPLVFPRDHAAHENYRIEWWYLTANLSDAAGNRYGVQWTLFRSALTPGVGTRFSPGQVWFAHSAVTTADEHFASETIARGGLGTAGVTAEPFKAWINGWEMRGEEKPTDDALRRLLLKASGSSFSYEMELVSDGPLVLHGDGAYSIKSESGRASYYYSQPFYRVRGTVNLPDGPVKVSGEAWLDREWSSQPLSADQTGWDWISLHLDTGEKLMGFQLRNSDGTAYRSASWIGADGATYAISHPHLKMEPLSRTAVAGRQVPTRWRVTLPERNLDVTIDAINPKAWMDLSIAYWEGPVVVSGSHSGMGYLEMTGYPVSPAN